MKKYIDFCADGVLKARYDSAINKTIPALAVEVSDVLFRQTITETDGQWQIDRETGEIAKHPFPPPPEPTPEEIQKQYLSAVDARMTAIASTRGYDSVESAAKYIGNTRNETWAAEGESLRDWAIDVYEACYAILAQVMAGEIPMPSIDELFGMLPSLTWPDDEVISFKEIKI